MSLKIRALASEDFPDWLPLWDGNNLGKRDEKITTKTWARLSDPEFPIYGFVAEDKDQLVGLIHYVLHPTTGSIEPVCYMQDVYVDPDHRQKGIARKMVQHLAKIGQQEKWGRMYWLAEGDNVAAQNLYKNLGFKLNFTLHVLPLNTL